MITSYASTDDVIAYRGAQSTEALSRLTTILPACSAELRLYAKRMGKNLDEMLLNNEDLACAVKKGVVDASVNYYNATTSNDPIMSQFSQAAGGYTISGTLSNPGGAFFFPKKFLRDIGLANQRVGTIEVFEYGNSN